MKKESPREREKKLRTFGLILGGLLMLAGWRWAHKGRAWAEALVPLGAAAALVAAAAPALLGPLERRWMAVARAVAKVNTLVIVTLVYYLLLVPVALLMRAFSGDPLERKGKEKGAQSYWIPVDTGGDLSGYERQF